LSITSPVNNSSFNEPATISLTATSADADGTVAKVDYYNGTTLLTSTVSPFSYTWSNVPKGIYALKAIATDNRGGVTVSSIINVNVTEVANGTGDGLTANYFNGMNFEIPRLSRKDATVNFN
jgi:hypothetical protein